MKLSIKEFLFSHLKFATNCKDLVNSQILKKKLTQKIFWKLKDKKCFIAKIKLYLLRSASKNQDAIFLGP